MASYRDLEPLDNQTYPIQLNTNISMISANNDYNSSLADHGSDGMGFHANGLTVGWWSFIVF